MWGDHDDTNERDALNKVENNDGDITHDRLAGAAAAVAMNEWNQKQERDGKPVSYAAGQTALAGLAVAAATHLIETKGMDQYDAYQAKHDAAEQAKKALSQSGIYGQQDTYETRAYDKDNDDERNNRNNNKSSSGFGGRGNNRNNDDDDENRNRGSSGYSNDNDGNRGAYNKRDNDNDNDNQTRGEGYGGVVGNNYGSGGAGQYGSGGIGGGRREGGENQFGKSNVNDNDGENKGYYNKEQGGEGFSGRNRDENEYGSENRRGEGRGDRSNDNERSNDY